MVLWYITAITSHVGSSYGYCSTSGDCFCLFWPFAVWLFLPFVELGSLLIGLSVLLWVILWISYSAEKSLCRGKVFFFFLLWLRKDLAWRAVGGKLDVCWRKHNTNWRMEMHCTALIYFRCAPRCADSHCLMTVAFILAGTCTDWRGVAEAVQCTA